jgi:hypothetical protein
MEAIQTPKDFTDAKPNINQIEGENLPKLEEKTNKIRKWSQKRVRRKKTT